MNEVYPFKVPDVPAFFRLSFRKRQVLNLISNGLKNKEIAETLGVTVKAVEGIRVSLKKIYGAKTTAELMFLYYEDKKNYE